MSVADLQKNIFKIIGSTDLINELGTTTTTMPLNNNGTAESPVIFVTTPNATTTLPPRKNSPLHPNGQLTATVSPFTFDMTTTMNSQLLTSTSNRTGQRQSTPSDDGEDFIVAGAPGGAAPPPVCPASHAQAHAEGRELVNRIIPTDVDTLFAMLFTDSQFFADLHAARKTFDISLGDWQKSGDGSKEVRTVSFTVTLSVAVGPKTAKVTETQVKSSASQTGRMYVIDVEQVNAGIPFADSFYITSHFCLTRLSEDQTKLCIVSQIKYKKSVWKTIKGFIEKNTWDGLEEFYTNLANALLEECEKTDARLETSMGLSRSNTPVPRRRRNTKGPAPDVPSKHRPLALANPQLGSSSSSSSTDGASSSSAMAVKVTLGVLICLMLLNGFLYWKLATYERISRTGKSRDQKELMKEQEETHRLELQKWHEALLVTSKLLQQAEDDMQSLKFRIASYETERFGTAQLKEAILILQQEVTDAKAQLSAEENSQNAKELEPTQASYHGNHDDQQEKNQHEAESTETAFVLSHQKKRAVVH